MLGFGLSFTSLAIREGGGNTPPNPSIIYLRPPPQLVITGETVQPNVLPIQLGSPAQLSLTGNAPSVAGTIQLGNPAALNLTGYGVSFPTVTIAPPTKALVLSGSNNLYISNATLGSYDRQKFAVSGYAYFTNAATGNQCVIGKGDAATIAGSEFNFTTSAGGAISWGVFGDVTESGRLTTQNSILTNNTYFHYEIGFDSANPVADDRMKMWINGVEITSFAVRTNPPQNMTLSTAVAAPMVIGALTTGSFGMTGNSYQTAMYSGVIPPIADLYNGGTPKAIPAAGLIFAQNPSTTVGGDDILGDVWQQTGTVTTTTSIPT